MNLPILKIMVYTNFKLDILPSNWHELTMKTTKGESDDIKIDVLLVNSKSYHVKVWEEF